MFDDFLLLYHIFMDPMCSRNVPKWSDDSIHDTPVRQRICLIVIRFPRCALQHERLHRRSRRAIAILYVRSVLANMADFVCFRQCWQILTSMLADFIHVGKHFRQCWQTWQTLSSTC